MSQKITSAQALELLKAAGAPVAEIVASDADATADFNTDTALAAIDASRTAIIKAQIEPTMRTEITSAVAGKSAGALRSVIARKTGIKRSDLEGLNEEEMIEKALGYYTTTFGKDTEDLRNQMTALTAEHAKTLAAKEEDWGKKLKAAEDKFTERDIDDLLTAIVKTIPRTGGNETLQAQQLKQYIRNQYTLHYDGDKRSVGLREKSNPEAPVFNDTKTKEKGVDELARKFFEDLGILATDTRHVDPNKRVPGSQQTNFSDYNTSPAKDPVQQQADNLAKLIQSAA